MQVKMLDSLPKPKRNIENRKTHKTPEAIAIAREFGEMYFDGPREYGYGGYRYDGRWRRVARDFIRHYGLRGGAKVLDVGCAKGYLVHDLMLECPGLEAFGLDISEYAIRNTLHALDGRLHLGNATHLPFRDHCFDLVVSINTLHNLNHIGIIYALKEIKRVGRDEAFVQVDSYHTPEQKAAFKDWVLTALWHGYPDEWIDLFHEAGYKNDYDWTIVE